jgi:hypothetical protein
MSHGDKPQGLIEKIIKYRESAMTPKSKSTNERRIVEMSWLKKTIEPEIAAAEEALKALSKKLEAEPKENWQASMAYEAVNDMDDHLAQFVYHLYHIADFPKPADYKHWRDKVTDDHFPL